jgi:hypothetical protein
MNSRSRISDLPKPLIDSLAKLGLRVWTHENVLN